MKRAAKLNVELSVVGLLIATSLGQALATTTVTSPDGANTIELRIDGERVSFSVSRRGRRLVDPSPLGLKLSHHGLLGRESVVSEVKYDSKDNEYRLPWGKSAKVRNHFSETIAAFTHSSGVNWAIILRAYDDGVAFRYRVAGKPGMTLAQVEEESTQFKLAERPTAIFNTLDGFTTSHESSYKKGGLSLIPKNTLLDCPLLLTWEDGTSAAITEARVRDSAGMYLERSDDKTLRCRLSPHPSRDKTPVEGKLPFETPWRVILLGDKAGEFSESNLLLCLNEPPEGDYRWVKPGKTTFHWWNGDFELDYKRDNGRDVFVARHHEYIDFCTRNNIAYHAISGDGRPWYRQSSTDYAVASSDADVRMPRPELRLTEIFDYAHTKDVGIRLWVHWRALSTHLDEAMKLYEDWGVKGLMVDIHDRDDQEMNLFTERLLKSAARHKIHIQLHGCSKFSGEQRTFPHLLNREGVLNLEYSKWNDWCTPQHNVMVAYTRALAGPVDYHHGGFRSVPRHMFKPREHKPFVMGTRCHHMALYVVYENPMPMVADTPSAYRDQPGFEFVRRIPTTWDETRFLQGAPGDYFCIARRENGVWYLGGINDWQKRTIELPGTFLDKDSKWTAELYLDVPDVNNPNGVLRQRKVLDHSSTMSVPMASGGGFVAVVTRLP